MLRMAAVALVIAVATLGEGGASAASLVVQHVLIAAFAVGAVLVRREARFHVSPRVAAAWLVFAALVAAGALAAPYAYGAWLVVVEIGAFGTLVSLAAADPQAWARVVPPAVAALGALHGIVAIFEKVRGDARPASTFLNTNHLGAWLSAAFLVAAGTAVAHRAARRLAGAYAAAAIVALAGVVVTGSRGAALGLAVGAAALGASLWPSLSGRARRATIAAGAAVVLAAAGGVVLRFRSDDDPYRFYRVRIWTASVHALAASPWAGTGPGQFAAAAANFNFPADGTPLRFERSFRTPHSDLLRAFVEFGAPAGVAALVALALLVEETTRRRRDRSATIAPAAAALVALGAQALVDDLTSRPALALLAAALAGPLLARERSAPPAAWRIPAARLAAVLVFAALGPAEIAGYLAWKDVAVLPRGPLSPPGLARLEQAIAWNRWAADPWARLAAHHAGDGKTWTLDAYAAAREAAGHAARLQPRDAFYAREAARVEARACLTILPFASVRDGAIALYENAASLARTDATIPLEQARFLLRAGDPAGARRAAESALKLEPGAAAGHLCLAEALAAAGQASAGEARRQLDEAVRLALPGGAVPSSPYGASMRTVDPAEADSLRRILEGGMP
ncbi:MAG TPA: O-antigen ligase family protein [Candidatus Polarisedimenticolaceae bacterium]|nr:O-antigen ligase family protein [Candidatus Polarisedimenticolaceae bacterium]